MSAPFNIPFNFQPINTVVGTTASYTVPAGKFAIIDIDLTSTIRVSNVSDNSGKSWNTISTGVSNGFSSSTQGAYSRQIRLKAGDVLSFANTSASNNTISTAFINEGLGSSGNSYQQCLVNSVVIATAQSTATFYCSFAKTSSGNSATVTFTTNNTSGYVASEYNAIS